MRDLVDKAAARRPQAAEARRCPRRDQARRARRPARGPADGLPAELPRADLARPTASPTGPRTTRRAASSATRRATSTPGCARPRRRRLTVSTLETARLVLQTDGGRRRRGPARRSTPTRPRSSTSRASRPPVIEETLARIAEAAQQERTGSRSGALWRRAVASSETAGCRCSRASPAVELAVRRRARRAGRRGGHCRPPACCPDGATAGRRRLPCARSWPRPRRILRRACVPIAARRARASNRIVAVGDRPGNVGLAAGDEEARHDAVRRLGHALRHGDVPSLYAITQGGGSGRRSPAG